jgi:hypothetical protein
MVAVEPGQRVGLRETMARTADAVGLQVVRAPLQVGGGQVDRGRRPCAADRSLHGGRTGVTEQVEEARVLRLLRDPQAQWPMVEEQACVEVIEQVDPQACIAFAHDDELATLVEVSVFAAALADAAGLQRDRSFGSANTSRAAASSSLSLRRVVASGISGGAAYSWT